MLTVLRAAKPLIGATHALGIFNVYQASLWNHNTFMALLYLPDLHYTWLKLSEIIYGNTYLTSQVLVLVSVFNTYDLTYDLYRHVESGRVELSSLTNVPRLLPLVGLTASIACLVYMR